MKLTKQVVKQFESDQTNHGTQVALHNVLFIVADDILKGIGCTKVKVSHCKK